MSHIKTFIFIGIALFAGFVSTANAEELTVEDYCQLTLERLHMAEKSWQASGNPPSRGDELALYRSYGTTQAGYLSFSSRQSDAIASYLAQNEQIKQEIENTSDRIKALITAREVAQ